MMSGPAAHSTYLIELLLPEVVCLTVSVELFDEHILWTVETIAILNLVFA